MSVGGVRYLTSGSATLISSAAHGPTWRRSGKWQQALLLEHLEPPLEHYFGVHDLVKAGLRDLDGRHDRRRAGFGMAITHLVVRILQRQPDEIRQRRGQQPMTLADAVPVGAPQRLQQEWLPP